MFASWRHHLQVDVELAASGVAHGNEAVPEGLLVLLVSDGTLAEADVADGVVAVLPASGVGDGDERSVACESC